MKGGTCICVTFLVLACATLASSVLHTLATSSEHESHASGFGCFSHHSLRLVIEAVVLEAGHGTKQGRSGR